MPSFNPGALVRHYLGSDQRSPFSVDLYYTFDSSAVTPVNIYQYAQALALASQVAAESAWGDWLAGDSHFFGCTSLLHVTSGGGILAASGHEISTTGEVGTLTGDSCPDYVAAVMARHTTRPGPSGRGRIFVPCVAEINTDTSRLTDGGQTALGALRDIFDDVLSVTTAGDFPETTEFTPALYSRAAGGLIETVDWSYDTVLKRQSRRRLRGFA